VAELDIFAFFPLWHLFEIRGSTLPTITVHLEKDEEKGGGTKDICTGLPDFTCYNIPNWRKIYQITLKYTKWPQHIPKR
jgi:hypothetical protein